ncbi:hypothetical protein D3C81_1364450 [compost metagenome]
MGSQLSGWCTTDYSRDGSRMDILILWWYNSRSADYRLYYAEGPQSDTNSLWTVHYDCRSGNPFASAAGCVFPYRVHSDWTWTCSNLSWVNSRNTNPFWKRKLGEAHRLSNGCRLYGEHIPSSAYGCHRHEDEYDLVPVSSAFLSCCHAAECRESQYCFG